jgi:hypothetical protein
VSVLSDNLPGWFKRRRTVEDAHEGAGSEAEGHGGGAGTEAKAGSDSAPATASTTVSVTTGGGSSQEPVVVWEAANLMEAQVVKGRLESEGIPAFVRSEALGVIYGLTAGTLARADVLVPGPLADKAVEILFADEPAGESIDEQSEP